MRHLVEAHGGSVSAASDGAGLGATFTVTLPLASVQVGLIKKPTSGEVSKDQTQSSLALKGLGVLVVDDESDARDLLTIALKQSGATVRTAANVRDALKILDEWET